MSDTPTSTYVVTNENGNVLRTIPNVLGEVRQSGCATDTSNLLTVAASAVLFVGMEVSCYEVPVGTYIVAIKDATHVVMSAAATGTATGLVACFNGFNQTPLSKAADRGWWRNIISGGGANKLAIPGIRGAVRTNLDSTVSDSGVSVIPGWTVDETSISTMLASLTVRTSDELAETPALRTKTENWSFWTLVSTGGVISIVPFDPEQSLHVKSIP